MNEKVKLNLIADVLTDDKGKVTISFKNPAYYRQQVQQLKGKKRAIITIESEEKQRSVAQNAYWHGVCFPILAPLCSLSEAEVKELCVKKFILAKVFTFEGKEYELRKGTKDLSKIEGIEFTDNLFNFAIELGGNIPTPCEAGYACGRRNCDTCSPMIADQGIKTYYPENNLGEPTF